MKPRWSVRARCLFLLVGAPVLMALTCDDSGPNLVDNEEFCNRGIDEERCQVSISMRNASGELVHLWTTTSNETIGPTNQLSAGAERCRALLIFPGQSLNVNVSAGRSGATLDTENINLTVNDNTVVNADWNGTTLSISTRQGTVPCVS